MGKGICMNKLKQMETALAPGGGQQAVDQMDNQTLLLRYKETGDMELKWALVLRYTDLVMLDLKEMDEEKHRALTGHGNQNIRNMASYLSDHNTPMWIRHVLVPGLTDDEDGLRHMNEFIGTLRTVERVEVLPYHTLGTFKWKELGIPYPLEGVRTPTDEEVKRAEELLQVSRYQSRQDGTAGKKRA